MTEDEMVGWHHQFSGHEFEQTPGDGEGQGSLGRQRVGYNLMTEQQQQEMLVINQWFAFFDGILTIDRSPNFKKKKRKSKWPNVNNLITHL